MSEIIRMLQTKNKYYLIFYIIVGILQIIQPYLNDMVILD